MALPGRSQSPDSSFLYLRVSAQKEAVLLRWAAATPLVWKQTNRCGFRLERYTVVRDKKILDTPERKILGEGIIRPRPLEAWKDRIEENDNASIVAQALYGEDFQLTGEDSEGLARIVNLAQELEQRFTFSLYAADLDFEVACMAGWGWRDTTVRPGEYYLYRVIPATQADSLRYGMASVYPSPDEYPFIPRRTSISLCLCRWGWLPSGEIKRRCLPGITVVWWIITIPIISRNRRTGCISAVCRGVPFRVWITVRGRWCMSIRWRIIIR